MDTHVDIRKTYITRNEIYIWRLALAILVVNGNVTMHDMLRFKVLENDGPQKISFE